MGECCVTIITMIVNRYHSYNWYHGYRNYRDKLSRVLCVLHHNLAESTEALIS